MGINLVFGISVFLRLAAAILALRLIRVTGKRTAWILIAMAVSLMAVRRFLLLFRWLSGDLSYPPDLAGELVGFGISLLILVGVSLVAPLSVSVKGSKEKLRIEIAEYRQAKEQVEESEECAAGLTKLSKQLRQKITERKQQEKILVRQQVRTNI